LNPVISYPKNDVISNPNTVIDMDSFI